jgi:ATP-dependent Clp protease ATP-binding subunit ClpA
MRGRMSSQASLIMSALEIYNQRFSDSGERVFVGALNSARRRGQYDVVPEHFIEALVAEEDRFFQLLMGRFEVDSVQIQLRIAKYLEIFPRQAGAKLRLAPVTIDLLKKARELATLDARKKIESFDLVMALADDPAGVLIKILKDLNGNESVAATTVRALVRCTETLLYRLAVDKKGNVIFVYDETAQQG